MKVKKEQSSDLNNNKRRMDLCRGGQIPSWKLRMGIISGKGAAEVTVVINVGIEIAGLRDNLKVKC